MTERKTRRRAWSVVAVQRNCPQWSSVHRTKREAIEHVVRIGRQMAWSGRDIMESSVGLASGGERFLGFIHVMPTAVYGVGGKR